VSRTLTLVFSILLGCGGPPPEPARTPPPPSAAPPGARLVPAAPVVTTVDDRAAPAANASATLLVSSTSVEQSEVMVSGRVTILTVHANGEYELEGRRWGTGASSEPAWKRNCRTLSGPELTELRRLVDGALAVIDAPSYTTSAGPPPSSNYSRSLTYHFAPGARFPEVQVAGWADQPEALARLSGELERYRAACSP